MLKFSVDEGASWRDYVFSETAIEVVNINEIENNNVYVYGRDAQARGVIIGLDLSSLFER